VNGRSKDRREEDGVFRTNRVNVESGYLIASGYDLLAFEQEVGATGRLKVLRMFPLEERSAEPRFLEIRGIMASGACRMSRR